MAEPQARLFQLGSAIISSFAGQTDDVIITSMNTPLGQVSLLFFLMGVGAILMFIFGHLRDVMQGGNTETIPDLLKTQTNIANALLSLNRKAKDKEDKKNSKPKIKVSPPDTFSGESKDVVPFLASCRSYFAFEQETDEGVKVHHIITNVSKNPNAQTREWANNQFRKVVAWEKKKVNNPDEPKPWNDYEAFEKDFEAHFCVIDQEEEAEAKLETLKMGKDYPTAVQYTTAFNSLKMATNYGDKEYYRKYRKGLNPKLLDKLTSAYPGPPKGDLAAWQKAAIEVDQRHQERQEEIEQYKAQTHTKFVEKVVEKIVYRDRPIVQVKADPNAMDISATTTSSSSNSKPVPADYNCGICKTPNPGHFWFKCPKCKCGNCGGLGHTTRDCKKPKKARTVATTTTEDNDQDFS